MQRISNIIISSGSVVLLTAGIYLALIDRPAVAATTLGFSFLFVVLLLLAKFQRFKGFGFECEMWEDKKEEVAALAERLTQITEAKKKIREKIKEKLSPQAQPGSITPEMLAEIFLDITDFFD
jgi:hypothetical protein